VRRCHHVSSALECLRATAKGWSKDQEAQAAINCMVERQFPFSNTIQLGRRQYDLALGEDLDLESATGPASVTLDKLQPEGASREKLPIVTCGIALAPKR
jgi:hypothetical protein